MQKIVVVDYGMGNLRSVAQALRAVAPEAEVLISGDPEQIRAAERIVLPGQGAMPDCMRSLQESGVQEAVLEASRSKPMFGVCVGEQIRSPKTLVEERIKNMDSQRTGKTA